MQYEVMARPRWTGPLVITIAGLKPFSCATGLEMTFARLINCALLAQGVSHPMRLCTSEAKMASYVTFIVAKGANEVSVGIKDLKVPTVG